MKTKHPIYWLLGILIIHAALALVYWHSTPYGAPPDEGPHGFYVQRLADEVRLPVFDPSDRTNYEFHQPPFYYALGTPFYIIGKLTPSEDASAVRLLSLILGGFSLILIYLVVLRSFKDCPLALTAAGFTALLPTHVMLSSSVSNDILVEVMFGLALLLMVGMLADGLKLRTTVALGIILGLGILAKTTCILLYPVAILAIVLAGWRRSPKQTAIHAAAAVLISVGVGGWWLARNHMLYGDPLAMSQFVSAFEHTAKPEYWMERGFTPSMYWMLVLNWTFASFWGVFGHMKLFMPSWVYVALAGTSLVAAVSYIGGHGKVWRSESRVLAIHYAVLIVVLFGFIRLNTEFFQAQGRYLYPAIIPVAVIWSLGWRRILGGAMPYLAVGIALAAQILALLTTILPRMPYYT